MFDFESEGLMPRLAGRRMRTGVPALMGYAVPLAASFAIMLFATPARAEVEGGVAPARGKELVRLVRQDCGSCHGLTLKGGLGPALLPETLHGKPGFFLVATILGGRPGTPMPPWRGLLTEQEAEWIVERLQAGFPAE